MKHKIVFSFLWIVALLFATGGVEAGPPLAPMGTGFTYQGSLTDAGAPANGVYDFEFKLFNDPSAGSQVGGTVTQGDVLVSNGLFSVQLDFGNVFDGTALYLEIGVRPGASAGAYTTLTPRQALSPTPYAVYASKSPWSGLSGVPAGFADGVDNGSAYQNVKIVAKSGGDYTTITAALNSITTASSTNRYLIWVAPGDYNERVTMKQFVDIEGAGELATKITFGGDAGNLNTGTVVGAANAELRFLTAENTGGAAYAVAMFNGSGASGRVTHVTLTADGATSQTYGMRNNGASPILTNVTINSTGFSSVSNNGIFNFNGASPTMTDVSIHSLGGTNNYGINNFSNSSPKMTDVTILADWGASNYGVYNDTSCSPIMTNVTINAASGTGNIGIYNSGGSSPVMTNINAAASGGTSSIGLYNYISSVTLSNSILKASGSTSTYGIYNFASSGSYSVLVSNSQISGDTNTIFNNQFYITRVGASQLSGGVVAINSGFIFCAGVYEENFAFYPSTCP